MSEKGKTHKQPWCGPTFRSSRKTIYWGLFELYFVTHWQFIICLRKKWSLSLHVDTSNCHCYTLLTMKFYYKVHKISQQQMQQHQTLQRQFRKRKSWVPKHPVILKLIYICFFARISGILWYSKHTSILILSYMHETSLVTPHEQLPTVYFLKKI